MNTFILIFDLICISFNTIINKLPFNSIVNFRILEVAMKNQRQKLKIRRRFTTSIGNLS